MALPYQPRFDGSDSAALVAAFQARGGQPRRCNTHSPSTGQMRHYMASKRKERLEAGEKLDDLPYYLLTYAERRDRLTRKGRL